MKNVCIFCGSQKGKNPLYTTVARELGKLLATNGKTLVYGGGEVGLMGEVARSCTENSGKVIGVIPEYLHLKEVVYENADEMITVPNLTIRKDKFFELSDAFIALPGGFGTIDEILDVITASQLGRHHSPCILLNSSNFFEPFFNMLKHLVNEGFVHLEHLKLITVVDSPEEAINNLKKAEKSTVNKVEWVKNS